MEHERIKDLVLRPATSPHRALAQKHLKTQLQKNDPHHGVRTDLIVHGLTIQDIIGLRGGTFTCSLFQTPKIEVRYIRFLDIAVMPFWKTEVSKALTEGNRRDSEYIIESL